MRLLPLAMLVSTAGWPQSIVQADVVARVLNRLEPSWDESALACSVTPYGPALNFSFRIQAGYVLRLPMDQFEGPNHAWFTLMRITPEGGDRKPVYLATRTRLPVVPKTKAEVEVGGGYLLGEGSYQVRWMMLDERGRVCRKDWRIEAKLTRSERRAKVVMRPNSVAAFSLLGSTQEIRKHDDSAPFSVTIMLHAAPMFPRRTHLRVSDRMLLVGSLAALLERLPARSVRLVVFNLDQQKELYRQDDFSVAAIDQVAQAMNDLELSSVDYKVLQKPKGHIDLLADLVNRELVADKPSDAVVFLGPSTRYEDKLPRNALEKLASIPKFFYFQYRPFLRRMAPGTIDTINSTVSGLKGKTVVIHNPGEFARAIDQLEKLAVVRP
jgi:hypothetical protein